MSNGRNFARRAIPIFVLKREIAVMLLACGSSACDSKLVIGSWACAQSSISEGGSSSGVASSGAAGNVGTAGAGADPRTLPVAIGWSTGFEEGFCGYFLPGGYCYHSGSATYEVVSSPVHGGSYAAAFSIIADGNGTGTQARCVRQGQLPSEAFYGAWFLVPTVRKNNSVWNLIHFHGGNEPNDTLHGLWDVSLANTDDGGLRLSVYNFLNGATPDMTGAPPVPVGTWFHVEVFLKRASDATGEFALYQDGTAVLKLTGLATDDSTWGQWYVGNLSALLAPADSTIFVDDVTISSTR